MADVGGRVVLGLQVEVPIQKPWAKQYVFDRLLSEVKCFQERVTHQFGVRVVFDLTQMDHQGVLVRRECPHMVPGQESDSEAL